MDNYIVLKEKLLQDIFKGNSSNGDFQDMLTKIHCSDAIIWNAFSPWNYGNENNPTLIIKLIKEAFDIDLDPINDFRNKDYKFFHKKGYFKYTAPDLVIKGGPNDLILEGKYTEDSSKEQIDECGQISAYFTDIFHKLISNENLNLYFIVLYPKITGDYYEYTKLIQKCKNHPEEIHLRIEKCLNIRKKKKGYGQLYTECAGKINTDKGQIILRNISQNIGLISWETLKELLFESLNTHMEIKKNIDNYDRYQDFFNKRTDKEFLIESLARSRSNI